MGGSMDILSWLSPTGPHVGEERRSMDAGIYPFLVTVPLSGIATFRPLRVLGRGASHGHCTGSEKESSLRDVPATMTNARVWGEMSSLPLCDGAAFF